MRVLSLFAGIGAYDLGLERAGFETAAFCEINPFCRDILAKHWPKVPIYDDVRTLTADLLAADGIAIDCIIGGFPCQDLSSSGSGLGLRGERSGLWAEFERLIRELLPKLVIVENSPELLDGWMGDVLGPLAALRYDAEWECIPASALGAPHVRDRLWIVAYAAGVRQPQSRGCFDSISPAPEAYREADSLVDAFQRAELPYVCRRHDGASRAFYRERLTALGNIGAPPQLLEQIGRAILASMEAA